MCMTNYAFAHDSAKCSPCARCTYGTGSAFTAEEPFDRFSSLLHTAALGTLQNSTVAASRLVSHVMLPDGNCYEKLLLLWVTVLVADGNLEGVGTEWLQKNGGNLV